MSNLPETQKDTSFLWQTSQVSTNPLLSLPQTFSFKFTLLCNPPFVVHSNNTKLCKAVVCPGLIYGNISQIPSFHLLIIFHWIFPATTCWHTVCEQPWSTQLGHSQIKLRWQEPTWWGYYRILMETSRLLIMYVHVVVTETQSADNERNQKLAKSHHQSTVPVS